MAGDRHHILPRFLMKGFSSRIDGEKVFTWLYRNGATPREVSTRDIAVEKRFYESPEDTADHEITEAEGPMGRLVERLREAPEGTHVVDLDVPVLVSHFVTRTKHLRDSLGTLGDYALKLIDEHFADTEKFARFVLESPEIKQRVSQQVMAIVPHSERPRVQRQLHAALPSLLKTWTQEQGPVFQAMAAEVIAQARGRIPELVKKTHVKSLLKDLAPEARIANYGRLTWSVVGTSIPMILGDVGVLFETGGPRRYKPYDEKDDLLVGAYLPLSGQKLLVGLHGRAPQELDIQSIRVAYTRACREFFIAGVQTGELEQLQPQLGAESEMLSREEMEHSFKEWFH